MTAAEFRAARKALRYTPSTLGAALGCSHTLVRRWEMGDAPPHPDVAAWLRDCLAHEAGAPPPPRGWQRVSGVAKGGAATDSAA